MSITERRAERRIIVHLLTGGVVGLRPDEYELLQHVLAGTTGFSYTRISHFYSERVVCCGIYLLAEMYAWMRPADAVIA